MKAIIGILTTIVLSATSTVALAQKEITTETKEQENVVIKEGLAIGNRAPELKFKNPEGKELALSELRGKMVLIDFWASWCGPCRMENPNLVQAYQKYKDAKLKLGKGFEIYSVSLDRNAASWKGAIARDQLSWDYHVSDLKFWSSEAAAIYRVRGIPTNVLIDKDGIIVAKNLRGIALHQEMDKHVIKFKN